ncbi:hypothetical protein NMG60_11007693 [Bertholletia excelsa]
MEFLELFLVALMPVLKTLLITALGLFLALEPVNLLGAISRHNLNDLVFYVFSPALVVSKLADSVTASNVVSLWFMPVNILLTFIIGSALGWVLLKITRTPLHLQGLVISCCAAGNLGNLPLIIIPAVCNEKSSPFGDPSTCTAKGEAYASLSMAIGVVYIWSYIYNIMRVYASKGSGGVDGNGSRISEKYPGEPPETFTEALLSKDCTSSKDCEAQPPTGCEDKVSVFKNIKQQIRTFAEKMNLKMLFAPATIATIIGLLIGVINPVRKIMIGENAPLRVLESSASLLGDATIPAMTLIVGANLLRGLKVSGVGFWIVVGVNVVRYIALPISGVVVVKAARQFGLVGLDPLYEFVLLLQYALPSAMAIGTITQLFEVGESECSVIMLWNYAVASIFLTLWSTFYMWLVS